MDEAVFFVVIHFFRIGPVTVRVLRVGEVQGDQSVRKDFPRRPGAGIHQEGDVHPGLLAAERAVGLIAGLHHADIDAGFIQLCEAVFCISIDGFGFFLDLHVLPGTGSHLFAGVRPEIGIMEIHDQPLAGGCRAFSDFHGNRGVTVSAAEAAPLIVIRIHPDPYTDRIDAARGKECEQIGFFAVEIIVFHAAGFLCQHAGNVHTEDEIFRKVLHFFHIQG